MSSDRVARESHEWAQASPIVVVSRIAAGGIFHGRSRHLWEYFIQVADAQWNAFSAGVRRRLTRRGWKSARGWIVLATVAEDLANKTYWKDSSAWERRPTVLGRTIYRERDGESTLNLGVSEAYMTGVIDSWHEKLKPNETPPKLEEITKIARNRAKTRLWQRRVKHGIAGF